MSLIIESIRAVFAKSYEGLSACYYTHAWRSLIKKGVVEVGKYSYGVPYIYVFKGNSSQLRIGHYTSITDGVKILLGGNHPAGWVSTFPFRAKFNMADAFTDGMPFSKGDITIGSDVWIGLDSIILSGVTIGHGAIITAGSVVTRDVNPYTIVGGTPAKAVATRFSEDIIESLLRIKWWLWDEEKIRDNIDLLSSNRINEFVSLHDKNISA